MEVGEMSLEQGSLPLPGVVKLPSNSLPVDDLNDLSDMDFAGALSGIGPDSGSATNGEQFIEDSVVPVGSGSQKVIRESASTMSTWSCDSLKMVVVNSLIFKPGCWLFLADTVLYYCTQVFALVSGVIFLSEHRWGSGLTSLLSTILPGMVLGLHAFLLMTVRTGMRDRDRTWLFMIYSLNLSRGLEARNYLRGSEPMWLYISADKHVRLALCLLPSICINVMALAQPDLSERECLYLYASSLTTLLSAGLTASLDHIIDGPPVNLSKYRFWDMEHTPLCDAVAITLIDFCSSSYRVILFAVVLCVSDLQTCAALLFTPALIHAMLTWNSVIVLWPSRSRSILIVLLNSFFLELIHDMFWLEPAPIHAPGLQFALPLRLLQALYGGWIICAKWDKLVAHYDYPFLCLSSYGIGCSVIYFTVCSLYLYLRRDRMSNALDLAAAFVASKHEEPRRSHRKELCYESTEQPVDLTP